MIKKIEDFIFGENLLPAKKFISDFCKSPNVSPTQLIYITGKTATGKTDLLNIMGTELLLNKSTTQIIKVETNDFINHLMKSIDDKNTNGFLNYYLQADILLIDGYEQLNRRPKTTIIIIQFIGKLLKANRKIVLASTDKRGFNLIKKIHPYIHSKVINLNNNVIDLACLGQKQI